MTLSKEEQKKIRERWNNRFNVDDAYIDTFVSDANAFMDRVKTDYGKLDYNSATAESSLDYYKSMRKTEDDLSDRAWRIQNYINTRKDNMGEDAYKGFSDYLKTFSSPRFSQGFLDARDYYSQWATLGDYEFSNPSQKGDFAEKSQYVSTAKEQNWWDKLTGTTRYGDRVYEYINGGNNGVRQKIFDALARSADSGTAGGELEYFSTLNHMTDDQIRAYNYHYATGGKETAQKYLDSIRESLNRQEAERQFQKIDGKTVLEMLSGVPAGLNQAAEGFKNAFNFKDDYIPQDVTQQVSGMVREDLSETGPRLPDWLGGASLGQAGYDTISTISNMAPSILVSAVAGPVPGTAMMGASAAGNAYQEKLNQGYSKGQARVYSTLIGASEATLQYLLGGISKLSGANNLSKAALNGLSKVDNVLARVAAKVGSSAGGKILSGAVSEGFEEGLQSVLEPVLWSIVSGEELDVSKEEALYASLMGAFTGGLFETAEVAGIRQDAPIQQPRQAPTLVKDIVDRIMPGAENTAPEAQQTAEKAQQDYTAEILDDAIAKATGAPADPVSAALEAFKATGTVTNKAATDILNSVKAVTQLVEETGVKLPDTVSGRRAAVKQAIADLAQQNAATAEESSVAEGMNVPGKTVTLEEASKKYGPQAGAMIHTYLEGQDVAKYDAAYRAAYEMGKSGVDFSYVDRSESAKYLTRAQRNIAYDTGMAAADATATGTVTDKQAIADLAQKQNHGAVDTATENDYNKENNQGGTTYGQRLQQDDRAGSIGDPAQGMAGVQPANRAEPQGGSQHGGVAQHAGVLRVSDSLAAAQQKRGTPVYPVRDTTSTPDSYEQALIAGRNSDAKNGWCVTPKSAQELAEGNVRTFMNESGAVGVGIAPDGDIVAVFKNQNGGPKKALNTIMPIAIEQGGNRLDCYGEGLVGVYAQYGFIPVARVEFNSEYANEGWTPDKGTPYIYFMMHNGDSAATVAEKMGTYPQITRAQLDSLPTYGKDDYDAAMAYRDSLMDKQIAEDKARSNPAPDESVGADAQSGYGENTVGGAQSRFKHEQRKSKVYTNTYTNATGEAVHGVGEEAQKANPNVGNYDYVSEKESWNNATQRTRSREEIEFEYIDLINKDGWTGEDNDTAMRVLAYLRKTGDTARLSKLALKQREQGTQGGQLTQSFAKYTRTPAYAADSAIVELSSMTARDIPRHFYKGKTMEAWKGEVSASIMDVATQIESVEDGDAESMKGIIRSLANFRHTTAMFGLRSNLTKVAELALKDIDFQTAKDIALAQLRQIPNDFRKRPVGQIVKTLRIHNMLSSIATVNRNIVGNSSIGIVDAVSDSTVGRALDAFVSLWTKKRTVGNDVKHAKTYFEAASKAAKMASLCAELDIPMESESRYSTGKTRTYSPQGGPVMRFLSAYEKYMKYALEVTDKFFEGGTNAAVDESLQALGKNANLSEKEIGKISEMVGQRRTFKDDRTLARATKGVKKALNELGTENIGLGDFAIPFAGTGSNVTQAAIDYNGGGVITGLYELAKLANDVKNGVEVDAVRQRQAVTNAARGITGVGLIAYFTALAAKGIIRVYDDKDKDERALDQSLGLSGAQMNISAWLRDFVGDDTDWRDDDWTVGFDFLEPFNAQMYVGYLLSQEDSVRDVIKAYPGAAIQGVAQSVLDMPMMQGLSDTLDLVSGALESFAADDDEAFSDAFGQLLGNYGSGFIPSWLRQTAYMTDPYYRDTTGENAIDKAVNQLKAYIPGLSQTLPKKYSGLGEEQLRHEGGVLGFFNTYINPGEISQISTSKIADSLDEISEATGNKAIYPDYIAPGSFSYTDENGSKQTVTITGKEMTETYQRTYGENVAKLYGELLSMDEFAALDAKTKAEILESAKSYATKLARSSVSDYSETPAYIKDRPESMSEAEAIIRQKLLGSTEKYTDLSIEQAAYISGILDDLKTAPREVKPDGSSYSEVRYVQQVEAIAGSNLTDEQQKQIMDEVLSDANYAKYLKILDQGYSNDDYATALRIYLDAEKTATQTKKQVILQEFMDDLDLTKAEAEALYKLYSGAK